MTLIPGVDVYFHDHTKHIYPYDQGWKAARSDFGFCSRRAQYGYTGSKCGMSDYAKEGKTKHAEAWMEGYKDYFAKQNKKPRKKQVPLPEFY